MMKNIIVKIALVLVLAGLVVFAFIQYKEGTALKQELARKSDESKDMKKELKRLNELKAQTEKIERQAKETDVAVPVNEKIPYGLFKTLLKMGDRLGLREISIELQPLAPAAGLTTMRFNMSFQARMADALLFMQKLSSLKRVTVLESVQVDRTEKIVPFQTFVLKLAAYTSSQ